MARDLYLVPKALHMEHSGKFANFHAMPIGDGTEEIVSILFSSDAARDEWESVAGVQAIGNEHDANPLDASVVQKLSEFGVTTRHTAKAVRKAVRAARNHPLF